MMRLVSDKAYLQILATPNRPDQQDEILVKSILDLIDDFINEEEI